MGFDILGLTAGRFFKNRIKVIKCKFLSVQWVA